MKLKEFYELDNIHIKEVGLRSMLQKYVCKELQAYSYYKSPEVNDWAFIIKGKDVWFAVMNGRRVTVKKAFAFIKNARKKKEVFMTDELKQRLFVEEL